MVKMHFPTAVKYNGEDYDAFVSFDVRDADVPELERKGGIIDSTITETPKRTAKSAKSKES
jgi:hypothetical protein